LASLGHPSTLHRGSRLRSVTARYSSSGRQPNFAAMDRRHHLYIRQGGHHVGHWPQFLFSNFPHCLPGGMLTNFSNQEVVVTLVKIFACRVINVWNSLPDSVSFSERELKFTFAKCCCPSVYRLSPLCCLSSVVCL